MTNFNHFIGLIEYVGYAFIDSLIEYITNYYLQVMDMVCNKNFGTISKLLLQPYPQAIYIQCFLIA